MQLYSCKVLLDGSPFNEVFKAEVTVPEIAILRFIHQHKGKEDGTGEVAGIEVIRDVKRLGREATDKVFDDPNDRKKFKEVLRTDKSERARLQELYDPTGRKGILAKLFGVGMKLPQSIEGIDEPDVDEPVRRTARTKPPVETGLETLVT